MRSQWSKHSRALRRGDQVRAIEALLVLLLTLLPATAVQACAFDLDCAIGSTCLKRPGQIYGVCRRATTMTRTRCAKTPPNILGVCMTRR